MKRDKIRAGDKTSKAPAVQVEVDVAESLAEVLELSGGDEALAVSFAMRGINIRRQDAFLRPTFLEGVTRGLKGADLQKHVQAEANLLSLTEKGKAGRPRKPPVIVLDETEDKEQYSKAEVVAMLAKRGMVVKQA